MIALRETPTDGEVSPGWAGIVIRPFAPEGQGANLMTLSWSDDLGEPPVPVGPYLGVGVRRDLVEDPASLPAVPILAAVAASSRAALFPLTGSGKSHTFCRGLEPVSCTLPG